jgi:type IV pilus assembly protein PilA
MTNPNPSSNGASSDSKSNNSTKIILIVLGVGLCCVGVPIAGILAAIALPSFLNQADRARESEAWVTIGSMARAQQAYRLESPEFATTVEELEVGIISESPNYSYAIVPQPDPATSVYMTATPKLEDLSGFSSGVFSTDDTGGTTQIVCESEDATPPPIPSFDPDSGIATCPDGSSEP